MLLLFFIRSFQWNSKINSAAETFEFYEAQEDFLDTRRTVGRFQRNGAEVSNRDLRLEEAQRAASRRKRFSAYLAEIH